MQNRDQYKLLYNNLWLYKFDRTTTIPKIPTNNPDASIYMEAPVSVANADTLKSTDQAKLLNSDAPISAETNTVLTSNAVDSISWIPSRAGNDMHSVSLIDNWDTLVENISHCTKCGLCKGRKNVVIERGSRTAKWMFVGEGPGEQEDIQGKPFVGASGQLLQKMIAAMGLDPATEVYICNVVKCRPPYNRNPEPNEIEVCRNYLFSQIELVKPQVIITLGRFAHQTLLNTTEAVGRLRLKQHFYKNIPLVVTYHPAYLLRNPSAKKDAWADLQLAMQVFKELA
jgi:uracil-DNA glycosylase family 4